MPRKKTHPEFIAELQSSRKDLECLGVYVNSKFYTLFKCKVCEHQFEAFPNNILSKNSSCPNCAKKTSSIARMKTTEQFRQELSSLCPGYSFTGDYVGNKRKLEFICDKGHTWATQPLTILTGHRCPSCMSCGFDEDKPAYLYYIKIFQDSNTYYKIGITNRSVKERFAVDIRRPEISISILLERFFDKGVLAKNIERDILINNSSYLYKGEKNILKCGGNTEIFYRDVLNLDFGEAL